MLRPVVAQLMGAAAVLCAAAGLIVFPGQSMEAAGQGLALCANVIVPSLFPFLVLSCMVVELGLARYPGRLLERVLWPLFRVRGAGASALVLGLVGGYPVGARTAVGLYEKGLCSRVETERLLAFCNNSGPAFIMGVVGAGVFCSSRVGAVLYFTHMAASVCVGLLFRFYGGKERGRARETGANVGFQAVRFSAAFTQSVKSAMNSVLNISAFVVVFTVVIRLLFLSGVMDGAVRAAGLLLVPLGLDTEQVRDLLIGLLEVSSGISRLAGEGQLAGRMSLAAFMLGWAGLCIHCQVLAIIGNSGLRAHTYVAGKILHGVISVLLVQAVGRFFPEVLSVGGFVGEQAEQLGTAGLGSTLALSCAAAWTLWLLFLAAAGMKKRGGKPRQYGV